MAFFQIAILQMSDMKRGREGKREREGERATKKAREKWRVRNREREKQNERIRERGGDKERERHTEGRPRERKTEKNRERKRERAACRVRIGCWTRKCSRVFFHWSVDKKGSSRHVTVSGHLTLALRSLSGPFHGPGVRGMGR